MASLWLTGKTLALNHLLRSANLDDDKLDLVAGRIKLLLETITAEFEDRPEFDLAKRLEAAYGEVKQLVDEQSRSHGDGGELSMRPRSKLANLWCLHPSVVQFPQVVR